MLGSLTGVLFVADALHTQTDHAEQITSRGAHLLLPAKGNQPTLHTQLKTLPWAQIPVGDRTRDRGHGRKETRTVKAVTLHTPGGTPSRKPDRPPGSPGPAPSTAKPAARPPT
ncbi:hypothetical protein [Actinoplanes rectilineatus]|uniref:hypothetical protein n=1 Tax=Actinoplanes rectilineatus TaxID=113571 RepID=UPI000A7E60F3|nr:hypothetical protein [Actinoplanes rectilineatus]